ncbi:flavodoxin [Traorella massiliensis]|uniref:flavodoxin n=1 Tax=Traorella massiliensis TaxID=1903263 RepID=UPI002357FF2A|nr:flavodoxin [Traorella massiliensis]
MSNLTYNMMIAQILIIFFLCIINKSIYTFLESYDFSGKTIIPFTVHGGSGFAGTIQTIAELEPDATVVEEGLSISRNSVSDAQSDVTDWLENLNI